MTTHESEQIRAQYFKDMRYKALKGLSYSNEKDEVKRQISFRISRQNHLIDTHDGDCHKMTNRLDRIEMELKRDVYHCSDEGVWSYHECHVPAVREHPGGWSEATFAFAQGGGSMVVLLQGAWVLGRLL